MPQVQDLVSHSLPLSQIPPTAPKSLKVNATQVNHSISPVMREDNMVTLGEVVEEEVVEEVVQHVM